MELVKAPEQKVPDEAMWLRRMLCQMNPLNDPVH